ncbi:hypothetical protein pb186bvf_012253 [Paramecium bursaria]
MDQISIRPLEEKDLETVFNLTQINKHHLQEYGEFHNEHKCSKDFYEYLLQIYGDFDTLKYRRWSIMFNENIIGQIGLHTFVIREGQLNAEIFYFIDQNHQGKGYVTKALQLLEIQAYEILDLDRLLIYARTDNVGSQKVGLKRGFVKIVKITIF